MFLLSECFRREQNFALKIKYDQLQYLSSYNCHFKVMYRYFPSLLHYKDCKFSLILLFLYQWLLNTLFLNENYKKTYICTIIKTLIKCSENCWTWCTSYSWACYCLPELSLLARMIYHWMLVLRIHPVKWPICT